MKVEEFEAKLRTVSDARLTQMHALCRREGPEIALDLILAEARRRGMDLEPSTTPEPSAAAASAAAASAASEAADHRASWTSHAPDTLEGDAEPESDAVASAPSGAWIPAENARGENVVSENPSGPSEGLSDALPPQGLDGIARGSKWLDEETRSSRLPKFLKVVLYLLVLAGFVAAGYKFLHRG